MSGSDTETGKMVTVGELTRKEDFKKKAIKQDLQRDVETEE